MNKKTSPQQPFHIQLAVDGSEYSTAAVHLLADLPLPADTTITLLGVVTPGRPPYEPMLHDALEAAKKTLEKNGIEAKSVLLHGHAAKQLIEYGREHRPDLMVIGARGLYATLKILLGGIAHQVIENASWPVLVMRTPYHGLRRVLFTTDGSQNCRLAAQYLAEFPLPEQTDIQVLHVQPLYPAVEAQAYAGRPFGQPIPSMIPMMPSPAELQSISRQAELDEQKGKAILAETKNILKTAGRKLTTFLQRGDPASEIFTHAQAQDIDLIVAGSRGLNALEGWWWDSVSRKLVHYAHCSVLFVRTDVKDDTNPGADS
jgi:nucleotide-binding universal stress UspA family protein